jgi:hypothetical protein
MGREIDLITRAAEDHELVTAGVMTAGDPQSPGSATPGRLPGFLSQSWDAVSVRTVGLIIRIFLSYVGAFHLPAPYGILPAARDCGHQHPDP